LGEGGFEGAEGAAQLGHLHEHHERRLPPPPPPRRRSHELIRHARQRKEIIEKKNININIIIIIIMIINTERGAMYARASRQTEGVFRHNAQQATVGLHPGFHNTRHTTHDTRHTQHETPHSSGRTMKWSCIEMKTQNREKEAYVVGARDG
jgi:hypothetical protein